MRKFSDLRYTKLDKILARHFIVSDSYPIKKKFALLFEPYKHLFTFPDTKIMYESLGSTFATFYASTVLTVDEHNQPDVIIRNFDFTMMYALVDFHLDDPSIPDEIKKQNIKDIKKILTVGTCPDNVSDLVKSLYQIYLKFEKDEEVIEAIKIAFEGELSTFKQQYEVEGDRESCTIKGYTMLFLHKKINKLKLEPLYDRQLGYIGQVCDDMLDINEDKSLGIKTLPISVLNNNNNLDSLYWECFNILDTLPTGMVINKYRVALLFLLYQTVNHGEYFSKDLKKKLKKYSFMPDGESVNQAFGKCFCKMIYGDKLPIRS